VAVDSGGGGPAGGGGHVRACLRWCRGVRRGMPVVTRWGAAQWGGVGGRG
jgi:hypothetical protein